MSASLLRQLASTRIPCSSSAIYRSRRCFAQVATLAAEPSPSISDAAPETKPAAKKPRAKKATAKTGEEKPKKKAKPKKSDEDTRPRGDPLAEAKSTKYLEWLKETASPLNPDDLERYRPSRVPANVESAAYAEQYDKLVEKLCRSWLREQLWDFNVMFEFNPRSSNTKHQLAEAIVERRWNWPRLKDVERAKRERTEISQQEFPIQPIQLFLLLGKDGSELLQMSKDFNVHISVNRDPLSLRVEGLMPSLKALAQYITTVKKSIVEDIIKIPGGKPINVDLLQPISRLSGAYVENTTASGVVRICAKDTTSLQVAKGLATRSAFESTEALRTALISYLPTSNAVSVALSPPKYSLYPFLSPRPLPWTMKTGGAFRIRRVAEWLGSDNQEDTLTTGGLAEGKGQIFGIDKQGRDLKETLFNQLPKSSKGSRVITASFGHVLFPSETASQRASIVPPLNGFWAFPRILEWIEKSRISPTFVPSLPVSFLHSAPKEQKFLVRFFYQAFQQSSVAAGNSKLSWPSKPSRVLKYEVVLAHSQNLAEPPASQTEAAKCSDAEPASATSTDFGVPVAHGSTEYAAPGPNVSELPSGPDASTGSAAAVDLSGSGAARCWTGVETTANIVLPDRPMDIRMSAFDHIAVTQDQEPNELQSYCSNLQLFLQGQPDADGEQPVAPSPPSSFKFEGENFVLHKSFSVRQSLEVFPGSPEALAGHVLSESILDLESQQKSTACEASAFICFFIWLHQQHI
ncbi:hypothetical protein FIBSPDRAFT_945253 [Athelia psychrophila]|uniref:Uncharacterized protein n=1 Tax=Athelia psychrophila TaxID=1759441 RepID=A0A166U1X6_9AGAM|nr:hypothetical protein FIBSPDRAFT_945253 [Fibularhizoctonia sp. CBS 109695]